MINRDILIVLCIAGVLAGCASRPSGETLSSLSRRPAPEVEKNQPTAQSREKAVEHYQRFVALETSTREQAEAKRRLTDLQLELAERDRLAVIEAQESGTIAPEEDFAELDYTAAAAQYEEVLEKFPDFPGTDEVLYQLSRVYTAGSEYEKSMAALDRLVREHPQSPYYAEAQFRRGENLFLDGEYVSSANAYSAVISVGEETRFYEHSLYKYGWAQFKQSEYVGAQQAFFALLDRYFGVDRVVDESFMEDMAKTRRNSVEDTLRSVSLTLYYQQGAATADEYFITTGKRGYESMVYARLGDFYVEVGDFDRAAATYRGFVKRNPYHISAPQFQVRVMEAYAAAGDADKVLAAKRQLVGDYALESPYWQQNSPRKNPRAMEVVRVNLQELAQHYHAIARRSSSVADADQAAAYYRQYVDMFPSQGDSAHMNFLLAEILFDQQRFDQAAVEYERTSYHYPPHERASEAAYAALLAYAEYEKRLPATRVEERTLWRKRAVVSAVRFAEIFPKHPEAATVLMNAADELFEMKEPAMANRIAANVIRRPGVAPELQRSAHIIMAHSTFDQGDYLKAESHYQSVLDLGAPDDPQRSSFEEGLAASIYKQAEQLAAAGDQAGAASHFLRVADAAPGSSIVPTALYDGAAALLSLEQWAGATEVLERFRAGYPNHELQGDVNQKLALAYLNSGKSTQAAQELEQLSAAADGDPQVRQDALWQAAQLYAEAGDVNRQIQALEDYVFRYRQPFELSIEARHMLAEAERARGNSAQHYRWLQGIVGTHRGVEGTERTRFLAASASLAMAETTLDDFVSVRLVAPLSENVQRKKRFLEVALDAYETASDYGVAEVTTAATYRIAELYREFSTALVESQRPKGLSDVELEEYELLLEEQAIPFEEKSIELHEINVNRTLSDGLYNDWVKKSYQQLASLYPVRYAKMEMRADPFEMLY